MEARRNRRDSNIEASKEREVKAKARAAAAVSVSPNTPQFSRRKLYQPFKPFRLAISGSTPPWGSSDYAEECGRSGSSRSRSAPPWSYAASSCPGMTTPPWGEGGYADENEGTGAPLSDNDNDVYDQLQASHANLKASHTALITAHEDLAADYEKLKFAYHHLLASQGEAPMTPSTQAPPSSAPPSSATPSSAPTSPETPAA